METLYQLFSALHSTEGIENLIQRGGIFVLVAIIFAETGLLAGFFLPGDSLLVTAGVLSSRPLTGGGEPPLDLIELNFALIAAAIAGDQLGFLLGRKTGPRIFSKPDGRLFKKKYALKAHEFYEKHGGKAVILARFLPILRTFVPFMAGVAQMTYRNFLLFSVIGSVGWIASMTTLGHFIGKSPLGEKIHYIILGIVVLSLLPMMVGIIKQIMKRNED